MWADGDDDDDGNDDDDDDGNEDDVWALHTVIAPSCGRPLGENCVGWAITRGWRQTFRASTASLPALSEKYLASTQWMAAMQGWGCCHS